MRLDERKLLLGMARAKITDRELSEKSGVSRPTLTALKSGRQKAKPATIGKLAAALGVDVTEILATEDK